MRSVMVRRVGPSTDFLLIGDWRPETPSLCALPMTAFLEISCPRVSAISLAVFPSDQSILSVFIISSVQTISALTLKYWAVQIAWPAMLSNITRLHDSRGGPNPQTAMNRRATPSSASSLKPKPARVPMHWNGVRNSRRR